MLNEFSRTQLLLGPEAMVRLERCRVAVFGVGGVGGYAVEALDLIDSDTVSLTNLNRQIIALHSTLGQYKVDVAAARVLDINPRCRVTPRRVFYLPETRDQFDFSQYDYIVDAIDTVKGKLALAEQAREAGVPTETPALPHIPRSVYQEVGHRMDIRPEARYSSYTAMRYQPCADLGLQHGEGHRSGGGRSGLRPHQPLPARAV